jgi:hypothetical protein
LGKSDAIRLPLPAARMIASGSDMLPEFSDGLLNSNWGYLAMEW